MNEHRFVEVSFILKAIKEFSKESDRYLSMLDDQSLSPDNRERISNNSVILKSIAVILEKTIT